MAAVTRAFQLAQNGNHADLLAMIEGGEVAADAVRPDSMFKGWSLLHAAASKGHTTAIELLLKKGEVDSGVSLSCSDLL